MKEREIPIKTTHNVISYDILIENKVVDPGYSVMSISIVKEVNKISTAQIVFKDGDPSKETFKISEKEDFIPGKKIALKIGRDGDNKQLFKGVIVKHGIKAKENGETQLILECKDEAVRMTIGRHSRYFENIKDSEIMENLIKKYPGLTSDVEVTSYIHPEMVMHHCTDWDFLMMRAESNGKLVLVNDGKIEIRTPETKTDPSLALLFGSTLIDFEAEMDASNQWGSVEAKSWNYADQSLFENTTDSVEIAEPGNISGAELSSAVGPGLYELRHTGQVIGDELQEWTKSYLQRSRLSKIQGRGKFRGFGKLQPGQMVDIQGIGARFTGKLYVSAIRHDVYDGSWYTQAQFGLKQDCFAKTYQNINELGAGGLLPAIKGLQIGKVVQLENDPEGENRILVRLPIIDNTAPGIWARIATLDAGMNRGSFFLPELEDEVIVGFLNDDPRDAVILGMLNSSAKPAPIDAKDVNDEKGFVTRSGMRVHFNDDTKTITIDTPSGNSVKLDEASASISINDQNGNTTKMDSSGIEMKSASDIKIEATGSIDIKAGTKMTLAGAQMGISAQTTMEVKGATAKLSSSGITEIKGSIVNIN